ncbi:MAG: discoidin domain-containing protein, partial [Nitrospirae bacterium]
PQESAMKALAHLLLAAATLASAVPARAALVNVAQGKAVSADGGVYHSAVASYAVDGDRNTRWITPSFYGGRLTVDLGAIYAVDSIQVWGVPGSDGRFDGDGNEYRLTWSDGLGHGGSADGAWTQYYSPSDTFALGGAPVRYVTYEANVGNGLSASEPGWRAYHWASLNELEVYAAAVPEPTSLLLVGVPALFLLRRRA